MESEEPGSCQTLIDVPTYHHQAKVRTAMRERERERESETFASKCIQALPTILQNSRNSGAEPVFFSFSFSGSILAMQPKVAI
jgi:hypothetical protein